MCCEGSGGGLDCLWKELEGLVESALTPACRRCTVHAGWDMVVGEDGVNHPSTVNRGQSLCHCTDSLEWTGQCLRITSDGTVRCLGLSLLETGSPWCCVSTKMSKLKTERRVCGCGGKRVCVCVWGGCGTQGYCKCPGQR